MNIKPIETVYKGYRFRSRLEARWAVFFEILGLTWEYEKEGFVLPSGRGYLPDFYLHGPDIWIEIKPKTTGISGINHKNPEWEFFAPADCPDGGLGMPGGCVFGVPGGIPSEDVVDDRGSYWGCTWGDFPYFFCECPECGSIGFQFDGRSGRNKHSDDCPNGGGRGHKAYNSNSQRIQKAAEAALGARFEHGEKPQTQPEQVGDILRRILPKEVLDYLREGGG